MFWIVAVLVLAGASCIVRYLHRLGFKSGRLSRLESRCPLTRMGQDQFIELSFGKVHYIYRPSSSPSSSSSSLNVFVHGFSIPMQIWQDVVRSMISENQPCLVFDLYGRGWSDAPDVPMNVDLFVSQLADLLFTLDLPYEKYNLFGVSMGGVIVQRFAELHPKKVSRLTLVCAAGLNVLTPSKLIMLILSIPLLGEILFQMVMTRPNSKSVRSQWSFPDRDQYQQHQQLYQHACKEHPGYLRSLFSTVRHFDFQSMAKSIEKIEKSRVPILIIWGDQDTLIPVENAYLYHKLYKDSSLEIISGANHSLLIEHSDQAIDAIKRFFREKSNH